MLAKRGVNLARIHHGYFDKTGAVDMAEVRHALEVVEAMKAEGIYSHFSIYFPLWLDPAPDNPCLRGYDGKTHPFAALYFNKDFQAQYRKWWKALLLTPSPTTGKRLVDEPAVMGLEIINEDSYFFWTFDAKNIPDAQLRIVEAQFGDWLKKKYGSIDAALRAWGGARLDRDDPAGGRVAFRPLWNIANERTARDKDTAAFLLASQRGFYKETYDYLRSLGFKGVITASNWATADPRVLGSAREILVHADRLHRPPRLFRRRRTRARPRSGRSATGTSSPIARPCGSTGTSRASRRRSCIRRWTRATTASRR